MSLIVTCKKCRKRMKASEKLAGKRVRCKCGHAVAVPAELEPAAAAPLSLLDENTPDPEPQPVDFGDLAELAEGEALVRGKSCPECFANIPEDGVLCTACGYDLRIGRRLGTEVQTDAPPAAAESAEKKKATPKKEKKAKAVASDDDGGSIGVVGRLVKATLVLGVIALMLWGAYHLKSAIFFDPQKQMEEDHTLIYAGMTVKEVVTKLDRKPSEILAERKKSKSKDPLLSLIPAKLEYKDNFMTQYPREQLKYGFTFVYRYSERAEMHVLFNGNGRVHSAYTHDPLGHIFGK